MKLPQGNRLILNSAVKAARGGIPQAGMPAGLCLKLVRLIVEDAYYRGAYKMYPNYLVAGTTYRPGTPEERTQQARRDPWASDFEASVKQLGLAIPAAERLAGDVVFDHNAAKPMGHVGILLSPDWVLENANPSARPNSIPTKVTNLVISPYLTAGGWSRWTLVARLPEPTID